MMLMPGASALPRPQTTQVVNPAQKITHPNRHLEGKMDRLMFGALTRPLPMFGLE